MGIANMSLGVLLLSILFLCPHKMHKAQCDDVEVVETVCDHQNHEHSHHNETKPTHEHQDCEFDAGHDHDYVFSKSCSVQSTKAQLVEIKTASKALSIALTRAEWIPSEFLRLKHRTPFHELQGVCLQV